jgi:hypothetical protein
MALSHACYPTAVFGDDGVCDGILQQLNQFTPRPCNVQSALQHVDAWLDDDTVSIDTVFHNVWGMDLLQFIEQLCDQLDVE